MKEKMQNWIKEKVATIALGEVLRMRRKWLKVATGTPERGVRFRAFYEAYLALNREDKEKFEAVIANPKEKAHYRSYPKAQPEEGVRMRATRP